MPRLKTTDKLEDLKTKQKQLQAQIRDLEAKAKESQRATDTRRKVIAGSLALKHLETNKDDAFSVKMSALLEEYVIRPQDRALFGLSPMPQGVKKPEGE